GWSGCARWWSEGSTAPAFEQVRPTMQECFRKPPWGVSMKIASVAARVLAVVMITALVAGCANTTRFHSPPTGGRLELLGGTSDQLPRSEKLRSKTFGQHEFHAVDSNGEELYGILPLSVDGGKIATSILFFAPA